MQVLGGEETPLERILANIWSEITHTLNGQLDHIQGVSRNGQEQRKANLQKAQHSYEKYLKQLDKGLDEPYVLSRPNEPTKDGQGEEKHWAELTPREVERQAELLNPQSQHNWLKNHAKLNPNAGNEIDDNESLASHDNANTKPTASRKRGGNSGAKGNLARQVGDRAVERAREGWSPSAASNMEDDELAGEETLGLGGSGRKRTKDPDSTYRLKGGKGGGTSKGKRKRSGEDLGAGSSAGGKKAKVDGAE